MEYTVGPKWLRSVLGGCVHGGSGGAREQISGIVGGQNIAATEAPLVSSATTPWSGFLLEKHDAGGRQDVCWGWHRTHVGLFTKGSLAFRINEPAKRQDFLARAGSVCVFPSGFDETSFSIAGSKFEAIVVELDPARLERLAGPKPLSTRLPRRSSSKIRKSRVY